MKRIFAGILMSLCLLFPLTPGARAAGWSSSANVVSAALSQLGAEEGVNGETPYGRWYGYPRGHWCDMFVSWCANQAGVPEEVFPHHSWCTAHMQLFRDMGRYQISMARGGDYVPQQGDVIFFYNPERYPRGQACRHVGIVLWVENGQVFTVEGNTITSRRDRLPEGLALPPYDDSLMPTDYVAVKSYPLTDPDIHGYGVPAYDDRSPLPHEGWVDLGDYEPLREVFDALDREGLLPGTSAYTYSPRGGMTRGDFLLLLTDLYGLSGWEEDTEPFPDVPEGCLYYDAAMTARSAGIASGMDGGAFCPDTYVSGSAAQTMISRTLAYLGLEDRQFSFSPGDMSRYGTPYTIRADIAAAVYALRAELAEPAVEDRTPTLNGRRLDGPVLRVGEDLYGSLTALQKQFPGLRIAGEAEEAADPARGPAAQADRVLPCPVTLQRRGGTVEAAAFWYRGERYVSLRSAAELVNAVLR